jgi:general secretion pathway protein A
MYQNFYKLNEKPFSLTPDPKFIYLSRQHQGALDHMLYGIKEREGFMAIVGDVGTGKTTLCRLLLERLDENVKVALVLNPMLSDRDLLRTCVHDLGVRKPVDSEAIFYSEYNPGQGGAAVVDASPRLDWIDNASKKELIDALNRFLLEQHKGGGTTVLIIDESQNLSLEVMEQLRILSNLETEKDKLLQIIFVGQLELNEKLRLPELKQLNQRISIRYEIGALSSEETTQYIHHRIGVAGNGSRITFTRSGLKEIFSYSGGVPRLINLVCDRTLLAGYNSQVDTLDRPCVKLGIRSLLGEEDKNYFRERYFKRTLPLVASVAFFLAGLGFFLFPQLFSAKNEVSNAQGEKVVRSVELPALPIQKIAASLSAETLVPGSNVDENYRIQVFSLSDQTAAEKEVQNLNGEGFKAYWKKTFSSDRDWYIVYVGPYEKVQPARIHLKALKFSGRNPILLSFTQSG